MFATTLSACILSAALGQAPAEAGLPDSAGQLSFGHVWSDSGGRFSGAAALVDYDGDTVVLKNPSGKLAALPIARLSTADREYLRSQATLAAIQTLTNRDHVWRLLDGTKLIGQARDFSHQKLVLQRRLGEMLVNGKPFKALTELQQYAVLKTVRHFDDTPLPDAAALDNWGARQRGQPRQFKSEAVLLELQDGQQATVPFFLFALDDQQYLRPGWERWLAAEQKAVSAGQTASPNAPNPPPPQQVAQAQQELARQYVRDRWASSLLELTAVGAGLIDEWRVYLYPKPLGMAPPFMIVIPGRDSYTAWANAEALYPNYMVGGIARVYRAAAGPRFW
ncbi:MAG: hypothetical protein ABSF26_25370 [Thermoguttaceae bacterium]|jgi:hypothetical protein